MKRRLGVAACALALTACSQGESTTAAASQAQADAIKQEFAKNFTASCQKSFVKALQLRSNVDATDAQQAAQDICGCVQEHLLSQYSPADLQRFDQDPKAAISEVQPILDACLKKVATE